MANSFKHLRGFVQNRMRMSHIYQPVTTSPRESDSNIAVPIDALPNDLDALRALVSSLSRERDAAIEECRRVSRTSFFIYASGGDRTCASPL